MSFTKIPVDLVDVVLLLEHDEVLLAATRSFHSIFVYFFCHNQPGIRAFESPLDTQRGFAPLCRSKRVPNLFAFRVLPLNFRDLARDLRHGKQRVSTVLS